MEILWIFLTSAAVWSQALGTCPKPDMGEYYQLDNLCYIVRGVTVDARKMFVDAEAECKKLDPIHMSGSLAVVQNQGVQSLLTSMLFTVFGSNAWVGLSQGVWTPKLTWSDGTKPSEFYKWAFGQPSGPILVHEFGQDCVEMVNDMQRPGLWYDVPCTKKNAYFCQVNAIDSEIHLLHGECGIPGYVNFVSSCFHIYTNQSTAEEARELCSRDSPIDGFLATIDASYENAFLEYLMFLQKKNAWAWIGLHQNSVEGPFTWADDYPIRFTNWASNMPNSYGGQYNCTSVRIGSGWKAWYTEGCGYGRQSICKYRIGGHHPPTPPPPINGSCPDGWDKHDSNCYLFKPATSKLTHNQAQYDCFLNYGARLASIHSASQNEFVRKMTEDRENSSLWLGLERDAYDLFQWKDGSPVDYEFWDDRQPLFTQKCVSMNGGDLVGSWRVDNCTMSANYACMMTQYLAENPPLETKCPGSDGWVILGDYCYLFSDSETQGQKSWNEAETWCNMNAGYLASLSTKQEQDFINKLKLYTSPRYWIGLRESSNDQTYKWSDDSDFSFKFWEEGEPYDFVGEQTCVELNMASGGKWSNQNCGVRQNFICKKVWNATSTIVPPTEPPIGGGCPDGWLQAKTKCFKFYMGQENKKTRMEAATECRKYDSYLAVIANQGEQALLNTLRNQMEGTEMWIGLSNIGSKQQYHWSDGSPVGYTNWKYGPYYSTSNCVASVHLSSETKWKSPDCTTEAEFACTKPASPAYKPKPWYSQTCEDSNYIKFSDSCYRFDAKPRTFDEAAKFCSDNGSTLATITDFDEGPFGQVLFYIHDVKDTWIGLRKNDETDAFGWLDHWPFQFTAWGVNQPGGSNTVGHQCAAFGKDAYWFDSACSTLRPTLCKYTSLPPPTPHAPYTSGVCDPTWTVWGTHCYQFSYKTALSWHRASLNCSAGSVLHEFMSVHSKAENAFITAQAKAKFGAGSRIWIGLGRNRYGFLFWSCPGCRYDESGEPVDYVNWNSKDVLESATGNCTQLLLGENGSWRLSDCNDKAYFVCKKFQSWVQPTLPPTDGPILSGAAVAGITVGAFVLVMVLAFTIAVVQHKRRSAGFHHQDTAPIIGK